MSHADRLPFPTSFRVACVGAALAAAVALTLPARQENIPLRSNFLDYPTHLGDWRGQTDTLDKVYLDALQLDDYLLANYQRGGSPPINLYMAYYGSQRKGQSVHSPRSCIPGGGWVITQFDQRSISVGDAATLPVNRVVVELGANKQLVYYWFEQRGRHVTNEFLVKWYIFWDALRRNRTDGALIRLTAPLRPGHSESELDRELTRFAAAMSPSLGRFVPN